MHRVWKTADFEAMSWHDNNVHALRIEAGGWGAGTLTLDIDYIEEWLKVDGQVRFKLVPAKLSFMDMRDLRLSLDYKSVSAGICPFSIHAIERRYEKRERYTTHLWTIRINWPKGEMSFEASGFEQTAIGDPVVCEGQALPAEFRKQIRI